MAMATEERGEEEMAKMEEEKVMAEVAPTTAPSTVSKLGRRGLPPSSWGRALGLSASRHFRGKYSPFRTDRRGGWACSGAVSPPPPTSPPITGVGSRKRTTNATTRVTPTCAAASGRGSITTGLDLAKARFGAPTSWGASRADRRRRRRPRRQRIRVLCLRRRPRLGRRRDRRDGPREVRRTLRSRSGSRQGRPLDRRRRG